MSLFKKTKIGKSLADKNQLRLDVRQGKNCILGNNHIIDLKQIS
jgi:hypothetical protein